MPTAIVTGATGIQGREIVFALGNDSQKWTKVHALSRSQKEEYPSTVQHDKIDLTSSAEEIAEQLKQQKVEGEYLFFAAYLAKDDEGEAAKVNGGMLRNFLQALTLTGAAQKLKRVILTTGAKQYGVHLGPVKCPMIESDPWIEGSDFPPNFYYDQQRILQEFSKKCGYEWIVTYPNDVIGVTRSNPMNLTTALALYARISSTLTPNKELEFPGSEKFYSMFDCFTSAKLHAEFNLWAALAPGVGNQAFNVVNGDVESWANMWPKLAKRFGCVVPEKQFERRKGEEVVQELNEKTPLGYFQGKEAGLLGNGGVERGRVVQRIDLVAWSQKAEVKEAWMKIAKEKGLEEDALEKATWDFLGFVLGREYDIVISMSKARAFGWTGYVDTWSAFEDAFERLEKEGIVA